MLFEFDPFNLLSTALFTILLQATFFTFATVFKTDKFTDITYSLNFVLLAIGVYALVGGTGEFDRRLLLAVMVSVWGLRLGAYLLRRIIRIKSDDRFDGRREDFIRFLNFWLFQALVVWVAFLPVALALSVPVDAQPAMGWLDWLGFGIWLLGFGIEVVADQQKYVFKNNPANQGQWIQSGLWRYSRHPNYFGEILVWWGVYLLALPALLAGGWWLPVLAALGPAMITWILISVSGIPLLEESADKRYGDRADYQAYKQNTSILIPWPPRAS